MQADCAAFAAHFAPRTTSLLGHLARRREDRQPATAPKPGPALVPTAGDDPVEPIYGKAYMPRKFKTAFALPGRQLHRRLRQRPRLPRRRRGRRASSATTSWSAAAWAPPRAPRRPSRPSAVPLCYVPRDDVLRIGEAVVKVHRDFGNRSDRKRARLKYVIHDWGIAAFRAKVEEYLGEPLTPPRDRARHRGRRPPRLARAGGRQALPGIPVENGRIKDEGDLRLASGLRAFFERYGTPARLTCQQSILLTDIDPRLEGRHRTPGSRSTASPRSSRSRPSGAGRWPARPCRPAAWP